MKKIRCLIAVIALCVSLGGLSLIQGMGSASMASAASSHHASSVAFIRPPCGGVSDC